MIGEAALLAGTVAIFDAIAIAADPGAAIADHLRWARAGQGATVVGADQAIGAATPTGARVGAARGVARTPDCLHILPAAADAAGEKGRDEANHGARVANRGSNCHRRSGRNVDKTLCFPSKTFVDWSPG